MGPLRWGCYEPFEGMKPGLVGLEDCGIPSTYLMTKQMIAE